MRFPAFDGELSLAEADRRRCARDFGGLVERLPAAVLRPASVDDVQRAVRFAGEHGVPVCARGQGHTTRGQAQTAGGLVIDLRGLRRLVSIDHVGAWVEAGARWDEVVRACVECGLTPPTLTDYLGLSVGGTLSVGGVGARSFRTGLQTDNVLELEVVTGTGERVRCSADRDRDVFDAVRGGLGERGIIVAARLALEAAPATVEVASLAFPDLATLVAELEALAADPRVDHLCAFAHPSPGGGWTFELELASHGRLPTVSGRGLATGAPRREPYLAHARRVDPLVERMRREGRWDAAHSWFDMFVPATAAAELIGLVLDLVDGDDLGGGNLMLYPLTPARCHTPLVALPAGPSCFLLDILATVPRKRADRLERLERVYRRILDEALARGATIYPIGFPLGTPAMDWRRQLGERWPRFAALGQRLDPAGVLGGVGIFR